MSEHEPTIDEEIQGDLFSATGVLRKPDARGGERPAGRRAETRSFAPAEGSDPASAEQHDDASGG